MPRRPRCNRFVLRLGLLGLLGAVACAMPIQTEHDSAPGSTSVVSKATRGSAPSR